MSVCLNIVMFWIIAKAADQIRIKGTHCITHTFNHDSIPTIHITTTGTHTHMVL